MSQTKAQLIDNLVQPITGALGSASAPTFSFTTDPNTGLYSPGADQLALTTGGTGRLFVDSSGNIGIADSNPSANTIGAGAPTLVLRGTGAATRSGGTCFISQDGTGRTLQYHDGGIFYTQSTNATAQAFFTNNIERLRITSAGLVGIGTSAPQASLDCRGFILTTNGTTRWGLIGTDADGAYLGTAGINHPWIFKIGNGSADIERMRLTATGLGIGTTNVSSLLHLRTANSGTPQAALRIEQFNAAATRGHRLEITVDPDNDIVRYNATGDGAGNHVFQTGGNERARIDSSGRLLVGTSTARSNVGGVTPYVQVEGASSSSNRILSYVYGEASGAASVFAFCKHRGTGIGQNTIVESGDSLGRINFYGADGTNFIIGASVASEVDGIPGTNDMPCRLVFSTTADGASSLTERMRIDSRGRVLIATAATPSGATAVIRGGPGGTNAAHLQLTHGTSPFGGGRISVTGTGGDLAFYTHTGDVGSETYSERLRVTSTGQVRLAGAGITFNGDTATANELDDYEEGTWTPTIEGTSTAGTGTYAVQIGRYTKIGNRVLFQCYVTWTAHTGTGNMDVAGLPFTTSAATNTWSTVSSWSNNVAFTAGNTLQPYTAVNTTKILLRQVPTGGGASAAVALDTAGELMLAGHYIV